MPGITRMERRAAGQLGFFNFGSNKVNGEQAGFPSPVSPGADF